MAFRKLQHLSYNYSKPLLINFAIKDFNNFDVKHVHDHVNLFSVIRDYFHLMVVLFRYLNKLEFALQSRGALLL